jgi:hypothetical protein
VNGIEAFGLRLRHVDTLRGDDTQPRAFEAVDDLAGKIAPGRIRLDDREGPFEGHAQLSQFCRWKIWRGL